MKLIHSFVVPCYNEEGNVEKFLDEVRSAMIDYTDNYEIVFVNDGSKDSTASKLRELWKNNKDVKIKVINFSRNFGKEAAMYAGLKESVGDYVTIIDADLQQSPVYAVEMCKILDEDADCDMVAAYQKNRKEGKLISFCKKLFYKKISKITALDMTNEASDFRTMRRCVVDTIVSLPEYHRFSKGIFSWVGYNTREIAYDVRERHSGETKWGFVKLIKYALEGLIAYSDAPLKWPLYSGISGFLVFVAALIVLLLIDLTTGIVISAVAYIVSALLCLSSINTVFVGVIGIYLSKIHSQVKERPIYITKEILSYENN